MRADWFLAFIFLVGMFGVVYYTARRRAILLTSSIGVVVIAVMLMQIMIAAKKQGRVPAEPVAVATQLNHNTRYCVLWFETVTTENHLASVVNMSDDMEIRAVRTIEALPGVNKCFVLVRDAPVEIAPPRQE